jgi:DNA invertase Pin-like site-specific DNA recombinase
MLLGDAGSVLQPNLHLEWVRRQSENARLAVSKWCLVLSSTICYDPHMQSQNRSKSRIKTTPVKPLVRASHNVVSKRVGYVRVSTVSQSLEQQQDALVAAGCSVVYGDHGVSGSVRDREGLDGALADLQHGDALVVVALDRLGRDLGDLVEIVADLHERGVNLVCLRESIDTTTPTGRMLFGIFGSLAEYERELVKERTAVRLAFKKVRGERVGRKPVMTPSQVRDARVLLAEGRSSTQVARTFNIGRATLYRHLAEARV